MSEETREESRNEPLDAEAQKRQDAYQQVKGWLAILGCEDAPSDSLIKAVADGRLLFHPVPGIPDGKFEYMLLIEVEQKDREPLRTVEIREPNASDLHWSSKEKKSSDIAMQNKLISLVSGLPLGIVERIGMRDVKILSELISFFS